MNKITKTLIVTLFASLLAVSGVAQQELQQQNNTTTINNTSTDQGDAAIQRPGAMPGSFGYTIVRLQERAEIAIANAPFIGSQDRVAMVRANHAQRRVAEALELIRNNKTEEAQGLLEEYEQNLQQASDAAQKANNTEINERINQAQGNQVNAIEQAMQNAPEEAQQGLQRAMENAKSAGPPEHAGPPENKTQGNNNGQERRQGPPNRDRPGSDQENTTELPETPEEDRNETDTEDSQEDQENATESNEAENNINNSYEAQEAPANVQ